MAWSVLQSAKATTTGATTLGCTFTTANVQSGTKLIAYVDFSIGSSGASVTSVKDAAGNTMTSCGSRNEDQGTSHSGVAVFAMDTPAGDVGTKPTLTATVAGGTAAISMLIQEVSGLATGNTTAAMLDGTASSIIGTAMGSTGNTGYASTASSEFAVSFYGDDGGPVTATQPSGWTLDTNSTNTSGTANCCVAYHNSVGAAESDAWSLSGTVVGWIVLTVAFKLAPTIALVGQAGIAGNSSTGPVSISRTTTAGNTLIVTGHLYDNGNNAWVAPTGITDTAGNTWVISTNSANSALTVQTPPLCSITSPSDSANGHISDWVAYCIGAAAVTSVTIAWQNQTTSTWRRLTLSEWSGIVAFDNSAAGGTTATATSRTAGPVNVSGSGELAIGVFDFGGGGTMTMPTGWTILTGGGVDQCYLLNPPTGTLSPVFTTTVAGNSAWALAVFSPVPLAAAATPVTPSPGIPPGRLSPMVLRGWGLAGEYSPPTTPVYTVLSRALTTSGTAYQITASTGNGDGIVVLTDAGAVISAVSDTQGNTWVQQQSDSTNFNSLWATTYKGSPGTPTVGLTAGVDTITITGPSGGALIVAGVRGASAVDANPAFVRATTATPSGPATGALNYPNEIVLYAVCGGSGLAVQSWASGFQSVAATNAGGGAEELAWTAAGSPSSVTPSATLTSSQALTSFTLSLVLGPISGTPHAGAANLSGSGTLTASAYFAGAATLTGSGTLTAAAVHGHTGAATLSGSGTLTASAYFAAAATLTGSGTLTVSVTLGYKATLSGTGTLTASAYFAAFANLTGSGTITAGPTLAYTASLTGSGTLTASAYFAGFAALTGSGTITATGTHSHAGAASLTGTGTLTASAYFAAFASLSGSGTITTAVTLGYKAALSGSGTLLASGYFAGLAALTGSGTMTSVAVHSGQHPGAATLTGSGTITASAYFAAAASLTGSGTLTASAYFAASASLSGSGTLTASAYFAGFASLTGSGTITATGTHSGAHPGAATLSGSGTLTANAYLAGAATLTGSGTITTAVTLGYKATLTGSGTLAASAYFAAFASLTGSGTITASGVHSGQHPAGANLTGSGSITANAYLAGAATLSGTGALTASAYFAGFASLSGSGTLTASAYFAGFATLSGSGTMTAAAVHAGGHPGVASLTGSGTLTATAYFAPAANLSGSGTLTASWFFAPAANLTGTGVLTATATLGGVHQASANLTGTGALATAVTLGFKAALTGTGVLTATPQHGGSHAGTATLTGFGTLSATGAFAAFASLTGSGTLAASWTLSASASLSGVGTLTTSVTLFYHAALSGVGTLTPHGTHGLFLVPATGTASVTHPNASSDTVTGPDQGASGVTEPNRGTGAVTQPRAGTAAVSQSATGTGRVS